LFFLEVKIRKGEGWTCNPKRQIKEENSHGQLLICPLAEAYGGRLAVEFGIFLCLRSVIVEGDALEIIQALVNSEVIMGNNGSLISDTRNMLSGFGSYAINHVRPKGNRVVHTLAKFAISFEQNKV
jgi:hypothetical protein